MKILFACCLSSLLLFSCQAQDRQNNDRQGAGKVGGRCEGCEAIHEYGAKALSPVDTLPEFSQAATKLKLTGTIYRKDGKTPAAGVILYIYHTDQTGIYPTKGGETGWARRHGYLRGWTKTGADGQYTFYTQRPATYPSRSEPAHIHATVKEPDLNEYYLDDYTFSGDPLLTSSQRHAAPKGGSGIVTLTRQGDLWVAKRDIVLGKNIEDYP